MSLIVTIFSLVFLTELVSWIGKSVLVEFVWALYCRVFMSVQYARQRKLKAELLTTKKELMQTSAQDQFAKWAKLRRSVDKGIAELEKLNTELSTTKSAFSAQFNTLVWVLTTGLQFAIGWWYRRSAVFYLPPNWFGPLTWTLALPFAPQGSVSVGVWQMACRRVIKVGEHTIKNMTGELVHRSLWPSTEEFIMVHIDVRSPGVVPAVPSEPAAVPVETGASSSAETKS